MSKAEGDASDADASVLWHMSLDLLCEGVSKSSISTAICIEIQVYGMPWHSSMKCGSRPLSLANFV
jgi:hypothetical protein